MAMRMTAPPNHRNFFICCSLDVCSTQSLSAAGSSFEPTLLLEGLLEPRSLHVVDRQDRDIAAWLSIAVSRHALGIHVDVRRAVRDPLTLALARLAGELPLLLLAKYSLPLGRQRAGDAGHVSSEVELTRGLRAGAGVAVAAGGRSSGLRDRRGCREGYQ